MEKKKSYFRTTEFVQEELNGYRMGFITLKSRALQGRADLSLFVPRDCENLHNLPVIILLHGVYGSHWAWWQKGRAHECLQNLIDAGKMSPAILVMPSDGLWGDGSGYVPHAEKDFERWIIEEIPLALEENLPQVSEQSTRFIAGLSMGGFGALRLGAKYGDRFAAFSGLSSITSFGEMRHFVEEPLSSYGVDETACTVLKTMLANRTSLSPFRFDCGEKDLLIEYNRTLHRELEEAGIAHQYYEHPGEHQWEYWKEHIAETFLFFNQYIDTNHD